MCALNDFFWNMKSAMKTSRNRAIYRCHNLQHADDKNELTLDIDAYREGFKTHQKLWAKTSEFHKKCTPVPAGLSAKSNTSLSGQAAGSERVEKGTGTKGRGGCFLRWRYLLPWRPNIVKFLPVSLYQKDSVVNRGIARSDQRCVWPGSMSPGLTAARCFTRKC